ncbi:MAG: hypothetical protein AVDCRST_MAG13-2674, partial [uncultured Solirubrobacteraceae bacterium]
LGARQQLGGPRDGLGRGRGKRPVARGGHGGAAVRGLHGLQVDGQEQDDRAALHPRPRERPLGVGHRGRRGVDALDHGAHGLRDRGLVHAEVRAQGGGRRVRREQQQRGARLRRLGEGGDRVREPRALVDRHDAHPAGHAGV